MSTRSRRRPSRVAFLPALAVLTLAVAACGADTSSPAASASTPASQAAAPSATPAPASSEAPAATPTPAPSYPLTVTDDQGTAVTIPAQPERIVALAPSVTEVLFRLGAGDRTVGKTEDIDPFPPEADDLPIVSRFTGIDVEAIVGLDADLAIADTVNPPDDVAKLRELGIPVVVLDAKSIDGALRDIELIGDVIGAGGEARDLTASMQARLDQLSAATAGAAKPRTFYEIGAGDTIYTMPPDSIYAEMLKLAGADPITADATWVIPLEKLVEADPEVIVIGDGVPVEDVAKRAGWEGMTAVKDGRVVAVHDTIVTRPGPRLVDGLAELIAAVHPEIALPSPAVSAAP